MRKFFWIFSVPVTVIQWSEKSTRDKYNFIQGLKATKTLFKKCSNEIVSYYNREIQQTKRKTKEKMEDPHFRWTSKEFSWIVSFPLS